MSITLPDVLILQYFPQVSAVVDAPGQFRGSTTGSAVTSSGSGDVGVAVHVGESYLPGGSMSPSMVGGTIAGALGVRGTSRTGRMSLQVLVESDLASHPAGGSVRVLGAEAIVGGQRGESVSFDTPGVGQIALGHLGISLDVSSAENAGWHHGIRLRLIAHNL